MNPRVLASCAAALDATPDEVLELRDAADLLPALLARLVLALGRPVPAAVPPGEAFCDAVIASYGAGAPFLASELLEWCALRPSRQPLLAAAQALCRSDGPPTARQLGIALKRLADLRMLWFRVVATDVRGTASWVVQDLRE